MKKLLLPLILVLFFTGCGQGNTPRGMSLRQRMNDSNGCAFTAEVRAYIGKEEYPLEQTLRLSDAFIEQPESPSLELITRVININYDKRHQILEECRVLGEYSHFVEIVREQGNDKSRLEKTVKECIRQNILKDYLERKSSEVVNMLMVEYDYDTDIKVQRKEAMEEGIQQGIEKNTLDSIKKVMNSLHVTAERAMEILEIPRNDYQNYLRKLRK